MYAEADIYDGNYHDIAFDYDNDMIYLKRQIYIQRKEKREIQLLHIYIIIIRLQEYRQLELKQEIIQIVHMVHTRVVKLKQSTY